MIKRQFYRVEHRENDDEASSSASSSEESEEAASSAQEESDNEEVSSPDARQTKDSSGDDEYNDGEDNAPDSLSSDDEEQHSKRDRPEKPKVSLSNQWSDLVDETLNDKAADFDDECVVICKNVLKCRLCPKTICLSSQSMQSHLTSKKHARSVKLMKAGRLKVMLNSDGEEEEQGETHAERYARTVAQVEKVNSEEQVHLKRKKPSGRQRQRKRAKRKALLAQKENNDVDKGTLQNKSIQKNSDVRLSKKKQQKEKAKLAS